MRIANKLSLELYGRINAHLLYGEKPSEYLNSLLDDRDFESYPFSLLLRMDSTEQPAAHHPEGNVWRHTMLTVDNAARLKSDSNDPRAFMWSALLHDIGKPSVTKNSMGRVTSYDHDRVGAELARGFLSEFTDDAAFIDKVTSLVRYHMHIMYVLKDLPFKNLHGLASQTDIREVALLGLCDRLGREGADEAYEKKQIRRFLELCGKPDDERNRSWQKKV